jgi:predicted DNA-binding transcriptional regulator YafY
MPRNDQVTRQWYLLRELESGKGLTLREMRQRLPEEIQRHDRTLRRDIEALKDGRLRLVLRFVDTAELAGWILSFGSQGRVVRPEALRAKVKEEARKIFRS